MKIYFILIILLEIVLSDVTASDIYIESNNTSSIVAGQLADDGEYPFYAIPEDGFLCGATLIHPDILMSAGHCQGRMRSFVSNAFFSGGSHAYIGGNKLDGSDAVEIIDVELERRHPNYNRETMTNDELLIKLAAPSSSPVAKRNTNPAVPADGDTIKIIGFGTTQYQVAENSEDLLELELSVVNFETCDAVSSAAYNGRVRVDDDTMLCSDAAGHGPCYGDSGGPVLSSDGTVVGIMSWLINGCAAENSLGVYARVSAFDDFIRDGICEMSELSS